jgi:hypothetical protein
MFLYPSLPTVPSAGHSLQILYRHPADHIAINRLFFATHGRRRYLASMSTLVYLGDPSIFLK